MNETNTPGGEVTKVPTREERERDKAWVNDALNDETRGLVVDTAVMMTLKYTSALEHVEAERDEAQSRIEATESARLDICAERDAALKFKTFVHAYLDQHGVPAGDPENEHQKEGCRIGARLDLIFAERDELVIDKTNLASANELLREENARLKDDNSRPSQPPQNVEAGEAAKGVVEEFDKFISLWSGYRDDERLERCKGFAARLRLALSAPSTANALLEMEQRKDAAYLERNQIVAALAKCFPSGVGRTAIEGWSEDWHECVYIDLPTGQVSWHFHDSHAHLFVGLPPYAKPWDGHTTEEKYRRLFALSAASSHAGNVTGEQKGEAGEMSELAIKVKEWQERNLAYYLMMSGPKRPTFIQAAEIATDAAEIIEIHAPAIIAGSSNAERLRNLIDRNEKLELALQGLIPWSGCSPDGPSWATADAKRRNREMFEKALADACDCFPAYSVISRDDDGKLKITSFAPAQTPGDERQG